MHLTCEAAEPMPRWLTEAALLLKRAGAKAELLEGLASFRGEDQMHWRNRHYNIYIDNIYK